MASLHKMTVLNKNTISTSSPSSTSTLSKSVITPVTRSNPSVTSVYKGPTPALTKEAPQTLGPLTLDATPFIAPKAKCGGKF